MKQGVIEKCARAAFASMMEQGFYPRAPKSLQAMSDESIEAGIAWTRAALAEFIRLGCPDLELNEKPEK